MDRSKTVPLLQFFFVRATVASYVTFVLSFFLFHISTSFWCLGKAVLRDCGISKVSLHIFLLFLCTKFLLKRDRHS